MRRKIGYLIMIMCFCLFTLTACGDNVDWSMEYENYFEKISEHIPETDTMMIYTAESDVIKIVVNCAKVDNITYEKWDYGKSMCEWYREDNVVYFNAEYDGKQIWMKSDYNEEDYYMKLPVTINDFREDSSIYTYQSYKEKEKSDGVTYDVLLFTLKNGSEDMNMLGQVDRKSRKLRKMTGESETGGKVELKFSDIDMIKIPKKFYEADQVSINEIYHTMMEGMAYGMEEAMNDVKYKLNEQ